MIIHHGEPCISCKHYSADTRDDNHWVCDFDHDTCPHIEELHKAVGYKERIDAEVLDKIRAEIEEKCCITVGRENDAAITLHDVFEIIGKYKASPTWQKGAIRNEIW